MNGRVWQVERKEQMSNVSAAEFVVPVHQSMNEILQVLGNPELVAVSALRRYLVDVCWQRIEQAEQFIARYEQTYGSTYESFSQRIGTDEAFLKATHQKHPTWEADVIEWEYRLEELEAWRKRLERILHESSLSPEPS